MVNDDLVAFLRARLNEDEATARGLLTATRMIGAQPDFYGAGGPAAAAHWQRWDPARVLAEVDAKRRILDWHVPMDAEENKDPFTGCDTCSWRDYMQELHVRWPCPTVRLLAVPYAEHPDYREDWRP